MLHDNWIMRKIKSLLRPIYSPIIGGWKQRSRSHDALHEFWKDPNVGRNRPEDYLNAPEARGQFVIDLIEKHISARTSVLEIGCNAGRNLNDLYSAGYTDLFGIEINENVIKVMRTAFPEMSAHATIYNGSVEETIKRFADKQFNIVFTMAVLEHIHPDSEWIFADMARITGHVLITVENEARPSWRQFPRNYRNIFESLGLEQIEEIDCESYKSQLGFTIPYVARVFRALT